MPDKVVDLISDCMVALFTVHVTDLVLDQCTDFRCGWLITVNSLYTGHCSDLETLIYCPH